MSHNANFWLDLVTWWGAAMTLFLALWAMPHVVRKRDMEGYCYLVILILVAVILAIAAWKFKT